MLEIRKRAILFEYESLRFFFYYLVHFPVDSSNAMTPPEKPPRSMSQTKSCGKKSKCSTIKRKAGRNGESKWYLESSSSININHNENTTISTPIIERPSRKLGKLELISFVMIRIFLFLQLRIVPMN
jgi:hypothetical protein